MRSIRGSLPLAISLSLLAASLLSVKLPAQMVGGTATDQPVRPLPPGMKAPIVDFRDLAAQAGLTAKVISGELDQTYIVENTGTGVAIFDYDNDGLPDIFLVQGDRLQSSAPPLTPHLYHNLGGLRFEDVTAKSGIGHLGWGQGVCAGDPDNNGHVDLFVTQWGHNVFLRNMGNGVFQEETKERGLDRPESRWSTGCAFIDYDRDGYLDLVVANYVDFKAQDSPRPRSESGCNWKGMPVPCGPRGLKGETMTLYHNDGHGHFVDVTKPSGIETPREYYGFTVLTGDFDNDGWPDIFIACDSTPSLYFHNKRNGTFEEMGLASGLAVNEDGREQAGMGATAADYDGDGRLDIFKTNFSNDTDTLYRNLPNNVFDDVTSATGLAVHTQYVKWGAAFLDFDNDGWPDLFVADGHVYPFVEKYNLGEEFKQPRQLFWNRGDGQFFDVSSTGGSALTAKHSSRGIAVGDLDNDGSEEIVTVNLFEAPSLLKNFGPRGNALLVRALTATGRDAVGARITLTVGERKEIDEVRSGGYHISQGDFRVHFGMGHAAKADLTIRWPDGPVTNVETIHGVDANQWIVVREGRGIIERHAFAHTAP
ncbi:ASPIC/UnbV domain protein [Acidisarcina polymorpha]|uniref:ASPIC/UnbV domain protein n=1 Tax=Acidisarcina polymorpha TaxID=2211140 RepID=A0A2Z5FTA3_9BACT|nr:CRTAC1 family protein [Acidisarcina polymorpha]AXC09724.1 ASPIC/UnbV domain protein [Acidisarcina polymorpha]